MKPHFHKVPVPIQDSFSIRHDVMPNFGKLLHYHPELELHYTIKGEGIRLVGDNISHFGVGEVILLGENLPHVWRSKDGENSENIVEAIVIQFSPHCLGKNFFQLPETYLIPRIFELAKKGLIIQGDTAEKIRGLMVRSLHASRFERILYLLEIIGTISESEDTATIASSFAFYKPNELESARLDSIYSYTLANFDKEISLEDIASVSNLSITSFCRYFKTMTKKTYFDFLTEVRISHACRMIVEDKYAINVICFDCGFNNVSNFYRHFKKIIGLTPFEYKKKYKEECVA